MLRGAHIDQARIILREQLRERTPARGEDGQPEGQRFNQIHRLVLILVVSREAEQVGLAQQPELLFARNETKILDHVGHARFGNLPVKFDFILRLHEAARHQQAERDRRLLAAQPLARERHRSQGVKYSLLAGAVGQIQHFDLLRIAARVPQIGLVQLRAREQLAPRGGARPTPWQNLLGKTRARIGNPVAHDPDLPREKLLGIRAVVIGQHDAEIHLLHQPIGERTRAHRHDHFQPLRQPGGMPMQNHPLEKRPADQHHNPIPIKGRAFPRRRDVIEIVRAITEPAPDGLQAIA